MSDSEPSVLPGRMRRSAAPGPAARTASMLAGSAAAPAIFAPSPRRRGMATVMAIVVIGLLASVLTATAARAVIEQRRAATVAGEVQTSRLLAAAAQIARQQIIDGKTTQGAVETPLGNVTFAWREETGAARQCDVTIDLRNTKQATTLTFAGDRLVRVE